MKKGRTDVSDRNIRERLGDVPVPTFETTSFTVPPQLSQATVAIVTTAGFRKSGDPSWRAKDASFRLFDADDREMQLGHLSPNFDRSGFVADINVVYPIDRLHEMAEEGLIGAVAPRHASFMGAQDETMETLRLDTGPALAKLLKEDGTDVVLLTPV